MRWRGWLLRWASRGGPRESCWLRSIRGCCPAPTPASREGERALRELLFDAGDLVGGPLVGVAGHVEALLGLVGRVPRRGQAALELAALGLLAAALGLLAGALRGLRLALLPLAPRRGRLAL